MFAVKGIPLSGTENGGPISDDFHPEPCASRTMSVSVNPAG